MPRISATFPPACPPKIICSACSWRSSALLSKMRPKREFLASPLQRLPSNPPIATTVSPSRRTSPYCPLLTCQASTPSQWLVVGGCANVHGQGTLQLQTSNQSPETCQFGISAIAPLHPVAAAGYHSSR